MRPATNKKLKMGAELEVTSVRCISKHQIHVGKLHLVAHHVAGLRKLMVDV